MERMSLEFGLTLIAVFFAQISSVWAANTCTWSGGNSSWNTPANWSCGIVPGIDDTAIVTTGRPSVDQPTTIGTLQLSNSSGLLIAQPLTVASVMSWTSGQLASPAGLLVIETGATLDIDGSSFTSVSAVINRGTLNRLRGQFSSGALTNAGTINVYANDNWVASGYTNTGTINIYGDVDTINPQLFPFRNRGGSIFVRGGWRLNALINESGIISATGVLTAAQLTATGGDIQLSNRFVGSIDAYSSTITLINATVTNGAIELFGGSALNGTGVVNGLLTNHGGTVRPGGAGIPGVLTVASTFQQDAGGTLEIDVGGIGSGSQHDVLNASFGLKLGGALLLKQLDGYVLQPGVTLIVAATNGARTGDFATQRSEIGGEAWVAIPKQVQVLVLRKQYMPTISRVF